MATGGIMIGQFVNSALQVEKALLMNEAFHLLHRAGQKAAEVFAAKAEGKLTPRQYAVMAAIAANPLASQTNLVAATGVDRSTLADIVKRLVRRGLVRRKRTVRDARTYQLTLTAEGLAELEGVHGAAVETDKALLSAISEEERDAFVATLMKIASGELEDKAPAVERGEA